MLNSVKKFKRAYNWMSLGYLVLGLVFLFFPELSLRTICYSLGILTIVYGIVHLIGYFVRDQFESMLRYDLVVGILAVGLGIFILIRPDYVASFLPVVLGIFILLSSVMKVQNAVDLKRIGYDRWWLVLLSALACAALGVVLLFNPFKAAAALMRFIGAALVLDGITSLFGMLCLVRTVKKVEREAEKAAVIVEEEQEL